jgi:hypothetical protein
MPLRQDGSGGTSSARPLTSIPPQRTSHDTELEGSSGCDSFFRPESQPRAELGVIGVRSFVALCGLTQRCELRERSRNGVGFE